MDDSVSEKTRKIYHEQHKRLVNDDTAMQRHLDMFSLEYFQKQEGWLKGKKCLDAGCGDTAKLTIRLRQLGADYVTGIDIGTDFIDIARNNAKKFGVSHNVNFISGSITQIPFPDNYFDFVACHGVIIHLSDINEANLAFSELSRVTKKGGELYIVGGLVGGLFEDCIIPALRNYYQSNDEFRQIIDKINPKNFKQLFNYIDTEFRNREQHMPLNLSDIESLFDVDFCVFIQNAIQAPVRLKLNEKFYISNYMSNGFKKPDRLRRFVERKNIRRYFAPLHFNIDHPISKILYGSGNLEFISIKIGDKK
jgi:ubiquinone/menaquinone biosynthesis C-methylase UbiE